MARDGPAQTGRVALRDRQRLIMTYDGGETACGPEELDAQIRSLVQCFEGSHVGIFQRCLGGVHAFQGSEVLEVDERLKPCVDAGVDPLAVVVDECHKCGMQAWGSYRMNDAHHTYSILEVDRYQTRFYKEHPELRQRSWRDHQVSSTYDWLKPEIRAQNLAFLRDVAERFDVDGLDLDFTRIPPFFNPDEIGSGREAMTQHVRDVRTMLDEVGRSKGVRLGLSAQLYTTDSLWPEFDEEPERDIDRHLADGLDVRAWVREGLLDILGAHCRSDSLFEMDVSTWVDATRGTDCRLFAGPGKPMRYRFGKQGLVEGFPATRTNRWEHRAIAHRLYEQGVDGILFYDYVIRHHELQWEVYRELGDPERMRRANKTYVYQVALPLSLGLRNEGGSGEISIDVPEDLDAARAQACPASVRLLLNITQLTVPEDVRLEVNGQAVPVGREQGVTTPLTISDHPGDSPVCRLEAVLEPGLLRPGRNTLRFELQPQVEAVMGVAPEPCEVRKVNVELVYRDETYPFWLAMQLDRRR